MDEIKDLTKKSRKIDFLLMFVLGFFVGLITNIVFQDGKSLPVAISSSIGVGLFYLLIGWVFTRVKSIRAGWVSVIIVGLLGFYGNTIDAKNTKPSDKVLEKPSKNANSTNKILKNDEFGFSFLIPDGWLESKNKPNDIDAIITPNSKNHDDASCQIQVLGIALDKNVDISNDEFLKEMDKDNMSKQLESMGFEVKSMNWNAATIANTNAKLFNFVVMRGDVEVAFKNAFFVENQKMYNISCSSKLELISNYKSDFNKVFSTFKTGQI